MTQPRASGAPRRVVVLDGPLGTELDRRGVSLPAPAWSARALDAAPDVVAAIHRDYVAAGATRYAELARGWIDAGSTIIGCCGTGPAHIATLVRDFASD